MEAPVVIAPIVLGTWLISLALWLGYDGALLSSWMAVLGAIAYYGYTKVKPKIPPPLETPV